MFLALTQGWRDAMVRGRMGREKQKPWTRRARIKLFS